MDHFQQLIAQVRRYLFFVLLAENAALIAAWWANDRFLHAPSLVLLGATAALALILISLITIFGSSYILRPTEALWKVIIHLAPGNQGVAPPKPESLRIGKELVISLSAQIYQFVTQAEHGTAAATDTSAQATGILQSLPVPVVALTAERTISFVNEAAAKYLGASHEELIGKDVYSVMNMSFPNDNTFDRWLASSQQTAALATTSWDRVRLKLADDSIRQFDLAAYYNQGNSQGAESILVLFDHSNRYGQDDQAISFVALSVHELRTPLTLLRGYIEVFEEELGGSLSPELKDFMHKMNASAQQLTAFVSNILNVARIENDQLVLSLQEANWREVLQNAIDNLTLRAHVRGIELTCEVADNLPPVGLDRVSIYEVVNNLVDNAIKYSGPSKKISITSQLAKDGNVETIVQDWGVGIPESVMPDLFSKFHRNFHNRSQIGGTGLGLYICKAIVDAHGGNIWVNSHEGKGSTFGFTLLPYAKLADSQKNGGNKEIVRGAHGWIKNHSMYRR